MDYESVVWFLIQRLFGARPEDRDIHRASYKDLMVPLTSTLLRGPQLSKMLSVVTRNMEEYIPNLISFASSVVDQSHWERISNTSLIDQSCTTELVVETNLCSLIREFMGRMSTPSVIGGGFLENFPNALQDIWRLDYGFKYLALGLPRWIPIPSLTEAYLARHRLLQALTEFEHALDKMAAGIGPGVQWGELDDVSEIFKQRNQIWREKYGAPPEARAAGDLSILWAYVSLSNDFSFSQLTDQ